jgi:gluconokinase
VAFAGLALELRGGVLAKHGAELAMGGRECVLVIDIGSSSTRCVAFGMDCGPLDGSLMQDKSLFLSSDATMDAAEVSTKTEGVVTRCLSWCQAHGYTSVRALGIDSFALSLLGVDSSGAECTPCYTYADARPDEYAQRLRLQLGEDGQAQAYERTGTVLHSSYAPAQYLRICAEEPAQLLGQVRQWRTLGCHIVARLSGRGLATPVGFSEASWTGMLNRHSLEWDAPTLAAVGLSRDSLPPLADFDDTLAFSTAWKTKFSGMLDTTRIFMALGDGAAANVGSGATDSRRVCATVGTSAAVRCVVHSTTPPKLQPGLWHYRISRDRHLIGGALSDAGSLYEWFGATLIGADNEGLWEEVEALAPDSHGLTVMPFLSGERATGWRGDATVTLHGITRATKPKHIVRAGVEAVCLRMGEIMKRLESLVDADVKIVAAGGPLENVPLWSRMVSDVLGKTLLLSSATEVTSRGVAVLICQSLGHPPADVDVKRQVEPDLGAHAVYVAAAKRNNDLYDKLYPPRPAAPAKL